MDATRTPIDDRSHAAASSSGPADLFATTRWSMVAAAAGRGAPASARALEEICRTYWFPLYAFVRRRGYAHADAEDLTQEFFRQFLAHRWIADVDHAKGRLRAFLVTAMKRFLAKQRRRVFAKKRGGGTVHLPFDTTGAEERYAADNTSRLAAEALFDRQWALTLLDRAVSRLEQEYTEAGKAAEFAVLKDALVIAHRGIDYPAAAAALGVAEGAARVAVHRLRRRFRALYLEEIRLTLPPGVDPDEEMRHLAESLARE